MSRHKVIIVGIISLFLLTSSLLVSKVFANSAENASAQHEQGIGENCDFGDENFQLIEQAKACENKQDLESEKSTGAGLTLEGKEESFDLNSPTSINCEEILEEFNEFLLSTDYFSIYLR